MSRDNSTKKLVILGMRQFAIMLLFVAFSLLSLFTIMQRTDAALLSAMYFFANTSTANVTNGWGVTMAIEPSQAFGAGSTLTVEFPDSSSDEWCRTAGSLSVYGVASSPPDAGGSWSIDQAMPGTLSATCVQGSGGNGDQIIISGIGPLVGGVTYGVEFSGNTGVLGTGVSVTGYDVNLLLENGPTNDTHLFIFTTTVPSTVTISATVLPMPECNTNVDCLYPLEVCAALQQCEPCTLDAQCNFGDICVGGACIEDPTCSTNADCSYPNEICGPVSNLCEACTADSQCNSGDRCRNGSCEPIPPAECTINANCGYPFEICDSDQQCNPCTNSSQCNSGDYCSAGVCTTPPPLECTTNSQCNYPNEICDASQHCNPCITDWECNFGDACVNNVCERKYECLTNDDCRFPNEVCTVNNECNPCTVDVECGLGNVCNSGVCEAIPPAECTTNDQCDYPDDVCIDQFCDPCTADYQCNEGDICVEGRCEPFPPAECTVNSHCDYGNEICDENFECNPCTDDDQCSFGDECKNGKCVYEPPPPTGGTDGGDGDGGLETLVPVALTNVFETLISAFEFDPTSIGDAISSMTNFGAAATSVSLITSVGLGMSLLNLAMMDTPILFTRGLFGLLSLLGLRAKGQPFGYVYNAITKDPLPNAMVRIFEIVSGKRKRLVSTSVTDAFGVFNAILKPGEYKIVTSKSGFRFPSRIVISLADYPIDKIYHGDLFEVESNEEIYYSIPVDPHKQSLMSRINAILRERFNAFTRLVQLILVIFGGTLSLLLFVTNPNIVNTVILILYIPAVLFTGYSFRKGAPRFGKVVDNQGNPVPDITLGLYDETEKRFLTKRVSDKLGKFRFVVPDGVYHLELINEPYEILSESKEYLRSSKGDDLVIIASEVVVQKKITEDFPESDKNSKKKGEEDGEKDDLSKPDDVNGTRDDLSKPDDINGTRDDDPSKPENAIGG